MSSSYCSVKNTRRVFVTMRTNICTVYYNIFPHYVRSIYALRLSTGPTVSPGLEIHKPNGRTIYACYKE